MKMKTMRQLAVSLLAGGGVFALLALGVRWNFWFSALAGVGTYVGLFLLLTPKPDRMAAYFTSRPDGGQMIALMQEAEGDLRALRHVAGQIADAPTRQKALDLTATGEKMYRYLRETPEKIPAAHQFLSYYLDTVGRILNQYVKFQNTGLATDEVVSFQHKVRALLPRLKKGFDEQWTQLMASERFDVEADMAVMSQLLHTEGLSWETKPGESA